MKKILVGCTVLWGASFVAWILVGARFQTGNYITSQGLGNLQMIPVLFVLFGLVSAITGICLGAVSWGLAYSKGTERQKFVLIGLIVVQVLALFVSFILAIEFAGNVWTYSLPIFVLWGCPIDFCLARIVFWLESKPIGRRINT